VIVNLTVDRYFREALHCTDEAFTVDAMKLRSSPCKGCR
jgi:hypothetical protein